MGYITLKINFRNHFLLIFILLVYIGLIYVNIKYPGLNGEEADEGYIALSIIKAKEFPLMKHEYTGVIVSYLLAPVIGLFGAKVAVLRMFATLWIVLGVILAYSITNAWFGKRMAMIFLLLVLSNAYFFQTIKLGFFIETTILFTFFMGSVYMLWWYFSSGRKNYSLVFFSALLFGLGLSQKIIFLYYVIAIILCYLLMGRKIKIRANESMSALFGFLIGCLPLILYNIKNNFPTLNLLLGCLFYNTRCGISNTGYLNNLWIRCLQLWEILKGEIVFRPDWGISTKTVDFITPVIFSISLVWVIAGAFLISLAHIRKRILLICFFYLIVFMLTPFTVSNIAQYHLWIIFPFPWLVMSFFMDSLIENYGRKRLISQLFYFFIAAIISLNLLMNLLYSVQMRSNKDKYSWYWSCNIYDITKYLTNSNITKVGVFVWEVHKNLQFLSCDRVFPWLINTNNFKPQPFGTFEKQAYDYISQHCFLSWNKRKSCYILLGKDDYYYLDEMNLVKKLVSNNKKSLILEKDFISEGTKSMLYRIE
jgi:hypothetical protein